MSGSMTRSVEDGRFATTGLAKVQLEALLLNIEATLHTQPVVATRTGRSAAGEVRGSQCSEHSGRPGHLPHWERME